MSARSSNNMNTRDTARDDLIVTRGDLNSTSLDHCCAACDKPAKLVCSGCSGFSKEAEQKLDAIRYCSKECQIAHRAQHKAICKQRAELRALYRAARLAQDIYLKLCESTNGDHVTSWEVKDSALCITRKQLAGHCVYHPFPTDVPNGDDRATLLTHHTCEIAMSEMWPVIEEFVKGLDLKVRASRGRVSECPRRVFLDDLKVYSTDSPHQIWQITSNKTGDTYALDLASAQFGHYQPLTPYDTYLKLINFTIKNTYIPSQWTKAENLYSNDNFGRTLTLLMRRHGNAILNVVRSGEFGEKKMKTREVLRLPQKDFDELHQLYVSLCAEAVEKSIDAACEQGVLVKRYGMYLLANDPLTVKGVHPHKQQSSNAQYEAKLASIKAFKLRAKEKEEKSPREMSFEQEKYEGLTDEQKRAVDAHMKGQPRTSNSRFTLVQGIFWHSNADQKVFVV